MPTPQEKKLDALTENEIIQRVREYDLLALELRPDAPIEGQLELIARDARRPGAGRGAKKKRTTGGAVPRPIVAEGDSWFDYYPAGLDVVYWLRKDYNWPVYKVARAGDTLENMAWGTQRDKWTPKPSQLQTKTIAAIRKVRPHAVLLSAGGNDFAGEELSRLLNHKDSLLPPIRNDVVQELIGGYSRSAFVHIAQTIWAEDPKIDIVTHGYAHPYPDGRPVIKVFGFSFGGPWLRPTLTEKRYIDEGVARGIMIDLVDRFNRMLAGLAADLTLNPRGSGRIKYIDLRPVVNRYELWENEFHLTNTGYRKVAGAFNSVL